MYGWMDGWVDEWMSVRPNSTGCLSKSPTFVVFYFSLLFWFTKNCQALQRSRRGPEGLFLLETWSNHGGIFTLLEGGSLGRDLCLASSSFQVGPSHWSGCVLGVATMAFAVFFFGCVVWEVRDGPRTCFGLRRMPLKFWWCQWFCLLLGQVDMLHVFWASHHGILGCAGWRGNQDVQ